MIQPSSMIAATLAALALYGAPALAADQIVGASLKPLPLYAQPGGGTPAAKADGQGMPQHSIILFCRCDYFSLFCPCLWTEER